MGFVGVLLVLMATNAVGENVEYESDPEEAKRSLTMRRREAASDDEDGEAEATDEREDRVPSDDSDGEGGVAEYDEEEEEEELEEEEEELDEVEEEVYEERGVEEEGGGGGGAGGASGGAAGAEGSVVKESDVDVRPPLEGSAEAHSEEKKENEPFAVPTAGAFYMHDDRFRDNAGARHRFVRCFFLILYCTSENSVHTGLLGL